MRTYAGSISTLSAHIHPDLAVWLSFPRRSADLTVILDSVDSQLAVNAILNSVATGLTVTCQPYDSLGTDETVDLPVDVVVLRVIVTTRSVDERV